MARLIDLQTFVRVAETGSFTRAGAELGIPKSTVSRRVRRLEDELDLALLQRDSRTVRLTERGRMLLARAAAPLRELVDVERAVAELDDDPAGLLRITVPAGFGTSRPFARIMAGFRQRWSAVTLDIDMSDRLVDMVAEGFDVGLRAHLGPLADSSSLKTRRVARLGSSLYASPEYLERRGRPRTIADLAKHDCITAHPASSSWSLQRRRDSTPTVVPLRPVVRGSDFSMVAPLVLAGMGIGPISAFLAHDEVAAGRLAPVLPTWSSPIGTLSLVWPVSRHPSSRVRAFIDHFVASAREEGLTGR